MIFDTKKVTGTPEILASNDYQAVPVTIGETSEVKAGMPITSEGKKSATGTSAIGILLYDVDPSVNPNAAVVVDGIVDWGKCKAHSGATATINTIAQLLPNITFRENGKTVTYSAPSAS